MPKRKTPKGEPVFDVKHEAKKLGTANRSLKKAQAEKARQHHDLGHALTFDRKFKKAIVQYRKALQGGLDKTEEIGCRNALFNALVAIGDYKGAVKSVRELYQKYPKEGRREVLGVAGYIAKRGQHDLARRHIKWLENDEPTPPQPDFALARSRVFFETGDKEAAVGGLRECLERYPNVYELHRDMVEYLEDMGRHKEAEPHRKIIRSALE